MSENSNRFKIYSIAEKIFFLFVCLIFLPFILLFLIYGFLGYFCELLVKNIYILWGYNSIVYLSNDDSFNSYLKSELGDIDNLNCLFKQSKYPSVVIYGDYVELIFYMETARKKFKYNKTKLNNILLKISECKKREKRGEGISNKSELNLHYQKLGFGHIQKQNERKPKKKNKNLNISYGNFASISRGKSSFDPILIQLSVLFIVLLISLGVYKRYKENNPSLSKENKDHIEKLVDKYYGKKED